MNRFLFLLLLVALVPSFGSSQLKLKNKLSVGYDLNYFPGTIGDQHTEGFPMKARVTYTHKEHTLSLNYKIRTRISAVVFGGFMSNKATATERGDYFLDDSELGTVRSISFGAGIHLYLPSGFAPTGNSVGLYLRQHNTLITNGDVYKIYRKDYSINTEFSGITEDDFKINTTYLGAKYNYTHMLFKNLPIYANAGIGVYIPIYSKIQSPSYVIKKEVNYSWGPQHSDYQYKYDMKMETLTKFYKRLPIFRINIGLAYCF